MQFGTTLFFKRHDKDCCGSVEHPQIDVLQWSVLALLMVVEPPYLLRWRRRGFPISECEKVSIAEHSRQKDSPTSKMNRSARSHMNMVRGASNDGLREQVVGRIIANTSRLWVISTRVIHLSSDH